jgi:hypothetical protein
MLPKRLALKLLCAMLATLGGCQTTRLPQQNEPITAAANLFADNGLRSSDAVSDVADTELAEPFGVSELEAVAIPPAGWTADPIKRSRSHAHQAWLSPTRRTAYGIIRINLPLPFIGPDVVLPRFLDQMRDTEGEATLLSRYNDPRLPGVRFVAEGGQYRLRANLMTRGFRAWAVYAGTLRDQPEMPDELHLAEAAREETRVGTTRARSRGR